MFKRRSSLFLWGVSALLSSSCVAGENKRILVHDNGDCGTAQNWKGIQEFLGQLGLNTDFVNPDTDVFKSQSHTALDFLKTYVAGLQAATGQAFPNWLVKELKSLKLVVIDDIDGAIELFANLFDCMSVGSAGLDKAVSHGQLLASQTELPDDPYNPPVVIPLNSRGVTLDNYWELEPFPLHDVHQTRNSKVSKHGAGFLQAYTVIQDIVSWYSFVPPKHPLYLMDMDSETFEDRGVDRTSEFGVKALEDGCNTEHSAILHQYLRTTWSKSRSFSGLMWPLGLKCHTQVGKFIYKHGGMFLASMLEDFMMSDSKYLLHPFLTSELNHAMVQAYKAVEKSGKIIILSAGNYDCNLDIESAGEPKSCYNADKSTRHPIWPIPLQLSNFVVVGSTDGDLTKGKLSSYSHKLVDIMAPGMGIYGLYNREVVRYSGTSLAAASVAAALMLLEYHHVSSPESFNASDQKPSSHEIIIQTAYPVPELELFCKTGGVLDVYAAMMKKFLDKDFARYPHPTKTG